jgi:hypothetical protein
VDSGNYSIVPIGPLISTTGSGILPHMAVPLPTMPVELAPAPQLYMLYNEKTAQCMTTKGDHRLIVTTRADRAIGDFKAVPFSTVTWDEWFTNFFGLEKAKDPDE